jgi:uracil-DNA glycosylase
VVLCRGRLPCDVLFVGEAPGVSEDVLGRPFVGPAGKLLDTIVERALDGQYDCAMTNLVACIPKPVAPVVVNKNTEDFDVDITRKGKWGNPFRIGADGSRLEVIKKYENWLPKQDDLLKQLPELSGKRLGCVCAPLICHGEVLAVEWHKHVGTDKLSEPPEESIEACRPRLEEVISMATPRLLVRVGKLAMKHAEPLCQQTEICDIIHPAAILRMNVSQQGLAMQRCVAAIEAALDDL